MSWQIDWRQFDGFKELEIHCSCGAVFLSHAQKIFGAKPHTLTRKPCPMCARFDSALSTKSFETAKHEIVTH